MSYPLKTLSPVYRQSVVALVHHGSLLRLISSRRYHPLILVANGRVRQIVPGDTIRSEVVGRFPRLGGSMHAIRHPYFFEEATPSEMADGGPTVFSFPGLIDERKGFVEYVDLAKSIGSTFGEAALFDLIGWVRIGGLPDSAGAVRNDTKVGPMPRHLFERQLQQTTYAVFPYNQSFYGYIASGPVLDALSAGKPLIALRTFRRFSM